MADDRDSGASSVVLAFLLGGLTGAALALLYAPRSGRETREMLGEKIRESAEKGRELRDEALAKGRELADDAAEYIERQKEAALEKKSRFMAAVDAGRQAYREEKDKEKA
jgi:gas vesicle protein